jgi:flavin reductase (DIM6/NTAB) family NADH-FMN oxidoreductase RutF
MKSSNVTEIRPAHTTWEPFDDSNFRQALGHFPTGVVLITAMDADERPVGMIVGSFTSVSLDPPLVAFLPSRSSSTYSRMGVVKRFAVNVLSADQEEVCRSFSSKQIVDKWSGLAWHKAPTGAPVIDDAVAWIDCDVESLTQVGDHDLVIGRVRGVRVVNPVLPLLFFQGGYGRFTPSSLMISSVTSLVAPLRVTELARPHMELLSSELKVECVAVGVVDQSMVTLANSSSGRSRLSPRHIGRRVPHLAPVGTTFVAWESEAMVDSWLARLPLSGPTVAFRERVLAGLDRVRTRGFSVVSKSPLLIDLELAADELSAHEFTPTQERAYLKLVGGLCSSEEDVYEPSELGRAPVRLISSPVFDPQGKVVLALQLWDPAPDLSEGEVKRMGTRLRAAAAAVSVELARST